MATRGDPGRGGGAVARAFVRLCAWLVPVSRRQAWLREWRAELWHVTRGEGPGPLEVAWGALADAMALRSIERASTRRFTGGGMGTMMREMRMALAGLLRSPGFTVVTLLTLAIGLGGSAAIFTLVDRVVLDPLPYPDSDRLVRLQNQVPGVGPEERWALSTAQWVMFTETVASLDGVALYRGGGGTLQTPNGPQRAVSVRSTASLLPMLGARARLGRLFEEADDRPDAPWVALLTHGFWESDLGSDPAAVGRVLTYNDVAVEVIGVLEPGFELPGWSAGSTPDLVMPLRIDRAGGFQNSHVYPAIGRLAAGAEPGAVEAEIAGMRGRLLERFPNVYSDQFFDRYGFRTEVTTLKADVLGEVGRTLWILFGAVTLVLLIAWANAVNLFVVRMEGRRRELAVRSALGGGRGAVARHLVAEGLVLGLLAAAFALLVTWWGVPALAALAPDDLPRIDRVAVGWESLLFTVGLALAAGLGLAAYPLLTHGSRTVLRDLSEGGRTASVSRRTQRFRSLLVAGQMALALMVAVGTGLLVETLRGLARVDPGVEPEGVVVTDLYLSQSRYSDGAALWGFYRELLERVRALPGVEHAGLSAEVPIEGGYGCTVQGFADETVYARVEAAGMTTCAGQEPTTPGYFEAMGIPVLEGRVFDEADNDDPARGAVVVSRAFAERFWPGESPIGKGVAPGGRTVPPFYEVVGVVGDVPASSGQGQAPLSQEAIAVYYPIAPHPETPTNWGWWWPGQLSLVVKVATADPTSVFPGIRRVVSELDPEIPLSDVRTMDEIVAGARSRVAFLALLLSIAAATALALAAVGIYGVMSYTVSRRRAEIGVRMALGARVEQVSRMVLVQTARLAVLGLVAGVAGAWVVERLMGSLLVGVEPLGALVVGAAALTVASLALVAGWLPARRAARVPPADALRAS